MAKILIADDEEQILDVMKEVLEGAGHEVFGVVNGEEALKVLENWKFDLAFLDVMMPKLNGYQLAAKIHGLPHQPKVIIVTARNFEKDENTIRRIGISAYLPKPFAKKDLLAIVEKLLSIQ